MKFSRKLITIVVAFSLLLLCLSCAFAEELAESTFKVAGVTFDNDDGSSRQEIICDLLDEYGEWEDIPGSLLEYEYKGNPAIYVLADGQIVGNIPADDLDTVLDLLPDVEDVVVRVSDFAPEGKTIYFARVTLAYDD